MCLSLATNILCAGDEHFGAGNKCMFGTRNKRMFSGGDQHIENTRSKGVSTLDMLHCASEAGVTSELDPHRDWTHGSISDVRIGSGGSIFDGQC